MQNNPANNQLRIFEDETAIKDTGKVRVRVGLFYENRTANFTGGTRLTTDSRSAFCPDIGIPYSVNTRQPTLPEHRDTDTDTTRGTASTRADEPTTRETDTESARGRFDRRRCLRSKKRQYIHKPECTYIECKAVGQNKQVILYRARLEKERRWLTKHHCNVIYFIWCHDCRPTDYTTQERLDLALRMHTHSLYIIDYQTLHELTLRRKLRCVNHGIPKGNSREQRENACLGWTLPTSHMRPYCTEFSVAQLFSGLLRRVNLYTSDAIPKNQLIKFFKL